MTTMAADIRKLEPLIKQIDPSDWASKGASDTYIRQLQSSQFSLQNLIIAADKLANDPERLTAALETFFQMERMELLLNSLREGVGRYQSPDLADALGREYAQDVVHRDRLRQHIRDLAMTREQELEIVTQEAQRCRNELYRVPRQQTKPQPTRKR